MPASVFESADPHPAAGEVDVAPAQRERLADPHAGEQQRREQRRARDRAPVDPRLAVELARRRDQRLDLLGAIERGPHRLSLLQPPALAAGRVAVDQLALDGDVEDLRQPLDRLVDRGRVDRALADLQLPVAVDLGDRDLRERSARRSTAAGAWSAATRSRAGCSRAALRSCIASNHSEANSWKVGSSGSAAAGRGGCQMPRRTSARTFCSSSSARARVQPSASVPSVR